MLRAIRQDITVQHLDADFLEEAQCAQLAHGEVHLALGMRGVMPPRAGQRRLASFRNSDC